MAQTNFELKVKIAPWVRKFIRSSVEYFDGGDLEPDDDALQSLMAICKLGIRACAEDGSWLTN